MKQSICFFLAVVCLLSGCVVTQTTDLGQPWLILNSKQIKPGESTADDLISAMGLPFKIIQGRSPDSETWLYMHVRKRQKTILIPPILPIYTKTRMTERNRIVIIMLTKRKVILILTPTEDQLKKGIPELKEEGANIMNLFNNG